jgi:hypothetical protein
MFASAINDSPQREYKRGREVCTDHALAVVQSE